jgi:hypothetical protein
VTFLYRFALTVTRRQPYIDWANSSDDEGPTLSEALARDRRTIYLVPESTNEPDLAGLIDEFWEEIFDEELAAWAEDEATWPSERTREMFDAWFEYEVTSSVYDLTPEEPLTHREVEAEELAYTLSHCAWCELEIDEHAARFAAFKLSDRSRFAARAGLTLSLRLDAERSVTGLMSPDASEESDAGEDIVFMICSSRCEKAVRKAVPRLLRKLHP